MLQSRPVTATGGKALARARAGARRDPRPRPRRGSRRRRRRGAGDRRAAPDADGLVEGEVLVTHMTAPDWVPLMRKAAAIVTDSGGMTCHAAIVSRELGIPCVVGTAEATKVLRDGELVTVDAGEGVVTEGATAPAAERGGGGRRGSGRRRGAGDRHEAPRQPLRALAARARRRARRRRRRPAARRADGDRGARGRAPARC